MDENESFRFEMLNKGRGKLLVVEEKYLLVKDKAGSRGNISSEYYKCVTCKKGEEVRVKLLSETRLQLTRNSKITLGHLGEEPKIRSIRAANAMIDDAVTNLLKKPAMIFNDHRLVLNLGYNVVKEN